MIATLLLMLLGSQAEATPGFDDPATTIWIKIEELRNSSIYIRPDTIKQISPTERSVWRKTIFVKPEDKVEERLVKNVIDCVAETITVTAITAYDKSGKVITSGAIEKSNQETDPVTPDSVSETIMNAVCAAGADVLNDAWGGADPELVDVAAQYDAAIICTHTGGVTPRTRPYRLEYDDVVAAAIADTMAYADRAVAAGVAEESVVIDPAHDFGKNTFHSLEVTRRIGEMVEAGHGRPVLVSLSNKDFVGESLDLPVGERLIGTLAATAVCALAGARIYRVHQVVETRQTVDMVDVISGLKLPRRAIRGLQ